MAERKKFGFWDCDNSLMATHQEFDQVIAHTVALLDPSDSGHGPTRKKFDHHLKRAKTQHNVDPDRIWTFTLDALREDHQISDGTYRDALDLIMAVYTVLPRLYPGAIEILNGLVDMNFNLQLVTHAKLDWTLFKLTGLRLDKFFPNPYIVDVAGSKLSWHWGDAVRQSGANLGDEVWGFGDNVNDDILNMLEAGFQHVVYLDFEDGWSVASQGKDKLPGSVAVAHTLYEALEIVRRGGDSNPR